MSAEFGTCRRNFIDEIDETNEIDGIVAPVAQVDRATAF